MNFSEKFFALPIDLNFSIHHKAFFSALLNSLKLTKL